MSTHFSMELDRDEIKKVLVSFNTKIQLENGKEVTEWLAIPEGKKEFHIIDMRLMTKEELAGYWLLGEISFTKENCIAPIQYRLMGTSAKTKTVL